MSVQYPTSQKDSKLPIYSKSPEVIGNAQGSIHHNQFTIPLKQNGQMYLGHPIEVQCPNCQQIVTTKIKPSAGLLTWLLCMAIFISGGMLGCCIIPFCVNSCKDCEHFCPLCNAYIGIYKRLDLYRNTVIIQR